MCSATKAARSSDVMRSDKMKPREEEPLPYEVECDVPRHSVGVLRSVSMRIEREGELVVLRFDRGGMVMLHADEARRAAKLLRTAAKKASKK